MEPNTIYSSLSEFYANPENMWLKTDSTIITILIFRHLHTSMENEPLKQASIFIFCNLIPALFISSLCSVEQIFLPVILLVHLSFSLISSLVRFPGQNFFFIANISFQNTPL